jgi:hypothetical protein
VKKKSLIFLGILAALTISFPFINTAFLVAYEASVDDSYTNPTNPKFSPQNFSFQHFIDYKKLMTVLSALFPVGTKKEFVEEILVQRSGATAKNYGDFTTYYHDVFGLALVTGCVQKGNWIIKVFYNNQNELQKIELRGPC